MEVWGDRVAGEPKGISTGHAVRVVGLVAARWEIEGRYGISFRTRKIEPAGPAREKSKTAEGQDGPKAAAWPPAPRGGALEDVEKI